MAAPKVIEAKTVGSSGVVLIFDSPLDENVLIPTTSFMVNYGQSVVTAAVYSSSAIITLTVSDTFNSFDRITVTYEPPLDLSLALRGSIRPPISDSKIKRCAVRSFSQFRVDNLIPPDEAGLGWATSSGLSGTYSPNGVCDDGSGDRSTGNGTATRGDTPTPDDFVIAFGYKEAVQLSNIDNPSANSVNTERVWMAIQDACALIDSYIAQAPRANKLIISSSRRRVALIFARFYLDSVRRREDVTADYERAIKELDQAMNAPYIKPEADCTTNSGNLPAIQNGGILRSWRIPKQYFGVNGKGLSGWYVDPSGNERTDWRQTGQNAETNNDEGNGPGAIDDNLIASSQPSDGGGTLRGQSGS